MRLNIEKVKSPNYISPSPLPACILNRFEQGFFAFRPAGAAVAGEFDDPGRRASAFNISDELCHWDGFGFSL